MDPVSPTEASTRIQTLALYLELGGTPPKVLDFLTNFGGHAAPSQVVLVHIQEIIVDVGIAFAENDAWTLVAGKKAGEWRGRAIAFRSSYTHTATTIHHRACSVVISDGKHKWGIISGHIPHHASLDETQEILQHKLVLGLDSGEVFAQSGVTPGFPRGTTARGGAIVHWMAEHSLLFPPQELHKPTHFLYSGQTPRRLDYLAARQELVKIETEPFLIMNRSWESFLFPNPRTVAPAPPTTTARQIGDSEMSRQRRATTP